MASRKKRKCAKTKIKAQPFATHIVTLPIATGLLCGSAEKAVEIFKKETISEMNKMMAACYAFHKTRHFEFHDTKLIGRPPPQTPGQTMCHPWGYLTFGVVELDGPELKKCIVSTIHHRKTLSPEDALLYQAKTVPWDELPELFL